MVDTYTVRELAERLDRSPSWVGGKIKEHNIRPHTVRKLRSGQVANVYTGETLAELRAMKKAWTRGKRRKAKPKAQPKDKRKTLEEISLTAKRTVEKTRELTRLSEEMKDVIQFEEYIAEWEKRTDEAVSSAKREIADKKRRLEKEYLDCYAKYADLYEGE